VVEVWAYTSVLRRGHNQSVPRLRMVKFTIYVYGRRCPFLGDSAGWASLCPRAVRVDSLDPSRAPTRSAWASSTLRSRTAAEVIATH